MNEPNLTGKTFGEYALQEMIGRGGMGTVYRAYQPSLKRDVAVKVLSFEFASRPGYIRRFTREAEVVAKLQHPHILPIQYYGVQDGTSYMVMPLLTGGTLARQLAQCVKENKPLPSLETVAALLKQIAGALDYAHRQGVIHRDIKPNNIMFDEQGNAYLLDFGIAKLMDTDSDLTITGLMVGAPQYISPEQWRGDELTPAADLYSLGATAYAMLTGRAPFNAETPHALMHKHLYELPPTPQTFREDLPEAVVKVLIKAMAKEPGGRYTTAEAFAEAFERAIHPDAPQSRDDRQRKLTDSPLMLGLGVVIALLFVILIALLLLRQPINEAAVVPAPTETASPLPSETPQPSTTPVEAAIIPSITPIDPTEKPTLPPTATETLLPASATPIEAAIIPSITPIDPTEEPTLPPTATETLLPASATPSETPQPSATPIEAAVIASATPIEPSEEPTLPPTATETALPASATPSETPLPSATPIIVIPSTTPVAPSETPSPLPPTATETALPASATPSEMLLPSPTTIIVVIPSITPPDPTETPTDTPTFNPPTATATLTVTPSVTPTATLTHTPTATPTFTPTATFTNTPLPTATPIIAFGDALFYDNFEDEDLKEWAFNSPNISIVEDEGGHVLQIGGSEWSVMGFARGDVSWIDYAFEARVKIIQSVPGGRLSDVNLTVRNHSTGNFVGWVSAARDFGTIGRNSDGGFQNIAGGFRVSLNTDVWYNLRLEADGNRIRLFVDETLVAFAEDNNPVNGNILISAAPGALFYVDDVRVISLDRSSVALSSARPGTATENLRIRSGPGTGFHIVDGLEPGDQVFIIRQNSDKSWMYIRKNDESGIQGWVSAQYIRTF